MSCCSLSCCSLPCCSSTRCSSTCFSLTCFSSTASPQPDSPQPASTQPAAPHPAALQYAPKHAPPCLMFHVMLLFNLLLHVCWFMSAAPLPSALLLLALLHFCNSVYSCSSICFPTACHSLLYTAPRPHCCPSIGCFLKGECHEIFDHYFLA